MIAKKKGAHQYHEVCQTAEITFFETFHFLTVVGRA